LRPCGKLWWSGNADYADGAGRTSCAAPLNEPFHALISPSRADGYGMATFFLLPSRPALGERFEAFFASLFPGLHWPKQDRSDLAEALAAAAEAVPGNYVVFREDLASETDLATCLMRDFGAEAGDAVIEMRLDGGCQLEQSRRWRLSGEPARRAA